MGTSNYRQRTGESRLAKELLPKILITDPVVQVIKETTERAHDASSGEDEEHVPLPAGWLADRVLKVIGHLRLLVFLSLTD